MKLERQADLRSFKASQAKVRNLAFNPRLVGSHGKVVKTGRMCSDLHSEKICLAADPLEEQDRKLKCGNKGGSILEMMSPCTEMNGFRGVRG